jgi:subtilisin family serine protease
MSRMKVFLSGLAVVLLLAAALPAQAATAASYVIEATTSASLPANLATMVAAAGGTLTHTHAGFGVAQATSTNANFAANLAAQGGIQSVSLDTQVQWTPPASQVIQGAVALSHPPTPPPNPQGAFFYGCQWNFPQINAPGAWAQGAFGSPKVEVAVLDTGIDPNHIDLVGKVDLTNSVSEITPGTSPCGSADETTIFDYFFHGTFVSSQITGNLIGMGALAPRSDVVMVKVLNCQGSGSFGDVISGIDYAASLPNVRIINMSLGANVPKAGNGSLIDAIGRAVFFATLRGKLVVVAAGNDGVELNLFGPNIELPAQSPGAIAIYATNIQDQLASYSNFGAVTWVGAPGGDLPNPEAALPACPAIPQSEQSLILGACSSAICGDENSYVLGAGTSFASPTVAGVAAQLDGFDGQPLDLVPAYTALILALTADKIGPFSTYANGRVNDGKAIASQH